MIVSDIDVRGACVADFLAYRTQGTAMSQLRQPDASNQEPIRVQCRDALGREQHITIVVRGGDIIVHIPPGEVAILDVDGIARLAAAAHTAAILATDRPRGAGTAHDGRHSPARRELGPPVSSVTAVVVRRSHNRATYRAPRRQALPPGALRALVLNHLLAYPQQNFSPGEIARVLRRSRGAVINACQRLVELNQARQTSVRPQRYQAVAPAESEDAVETGDSVT